MPKNSEDVFIQGKVKWFRHVTPDSEYQKWSHDLYPNEKGLEIIRELQARGLKNVLKKDDDGYYIRLSRPTNKLIKGKVVGFAPPMVFMSDGVTPLRNMNVGNGSDVTTKLEVYSHKTPGGGKAVAARWESTKVDNLVPFEGDRDFLPTEALSAKGLDKQPPQE